MPYWLIVFLFSPEGEYITRDDYVVENREQCQELAGRVAKTLVNTHIVSQFYCVTDDHYNGRSIDPGIPLD